MSSIKNNESEESTLCDVVKARDEHGRWMPGYAPNRERGKPISAHIRELLEMPIETVKEIASALESRKAHKSTRSIVAARYLAAKAILNSCEQAIYFKELNERSEGKVRDELGLRPAPSIMVTTNVLVSVPRQDALVSSTAQQVTLEEPHGTEE